MRTIKLTNRLNIQLVIEDLGLRFGPGESKFVHEESYNRSVDAKRYSSWMTKDVLPESFSHVAHVAEPNFAPIMKPQEVDSVLHTLKKFQEAALSEDGLSEPQNEALQDLTQSLAESFPEAEVESTPESETPSATEPEAPAAEEVVEETTVPAAETAPEAPVEPVQEAAVDESVSEVSETEAAPEAEVAAEAPAVEEASEKPAKKTKKK